MKPRRLLLAVGVFFLLAAFEQKEGVVRELPAPPSVEEIIERERRLKRTDVIEKRLIDVSELFTWSDFAAVRDHILAGGETSLFGNAYSALPYLEHGGYMFWLLPRGQFIPDINDPETYIGLVIRDFFHHSVGSQYYELTPREDRSGTDLQLRCDSGVPDDLIVDNLRIYLAAILGAVN